MPVWCRAAEQCKELVRRLCGRDVCHSVMAGTCG